MAQAKSQTPTGKVYVFSTLTNATKYVDYENGGADLKHEKRSVMIHGGTGIATKHLITPMGVMTPISAEDYDWLKDDFHFKEHIKKGFIKVEKKAYEPEKVASDMKTGDGSAPITPSDYEGAKDDQIKEPSVGKV